MAFYNFNGETKPLSRILRTGLDNLRDGIYKLSRVLDDMNQMSDAQIAEMFDIQAVSGGNTAAQQAAALKSEMASDIGRLLSDASQSNVHAGLVQLFSQTG